MDIKGLIQAYRVAKDIASKLQARAIEVKKTSKEKKKANNLDKDLNPHNFQFDDNKFQELLDENSFEDLYEKYSTQEVKKEIKQLKLESENKPIIPTSNHLLPIRTVEHKSGDSLRKVTTLWNYLYLSLPLDIAIFYFLDHYFYFMVQPKALEVLFVSAIVISGFFALSRNYILQYLKLKRIQKRFTNLKNSKYYIPIALLFAILPILHLLVQAFSVQNLSILIFGIFVLISAIFGNYTQVIKDQKKYQEMNKDKANWLQQLNREIYIISTIPIITARLVSLIGMMIVLTGGGTTVQLALYLCASVLLLYFLKPQKELYMIHCKKCSAWTSIALYYEGFCPVCMREEFALIAEKEKELEFSVFNNNDKEVEIESSVAS